ncbi:hypothetical protein MASR2M15_14360 [Anaerolineales bacterium]
MFLIILFMLIFGTIHSLTARHSTKEKVRAMLGERLYEGWYRLFYNLLSVLLLIPPFLILFTEKSPILWSVDGVVKIIFIGIQLLGMVGLLLSILQIDGLRFMGLTQLSAYLQNKALPLPLEPLQTQGVYALVRHPLYLFSMIVLWFMPEVSANYFVIALSISIYFIIGSIFEENQMLRYYGQSYQDYRRKVPRLLPFYR